MIKIYTHLRRKGYTIDENSYQYSTNVLLIHASDPCKKSNKISNPI